MAGLSWEATRVGADTQLAQVVRMVEGGPKRQGSRVQRLADRVSAVFVPMVIALAVATLGFWLGQAAGSRSRLPLQWRC